MPCATTSLRFAWRRSTGVHGPICCFCSGRSSSFGLSIKSSRGPGTPCGTRGIPAEHASVSAIDVRLPSGPRPVAHVRGGGVNRMRILYVLNGFDQGGAERGLLKLVESGAFEDHELRVLALCRGRGDLANTI